MNIRAFLQWAVTNVEFLIAFYVVCGNGLRYVLPISLQGRSMDILTGMTDVALDECKLNMDNLSRVYTPYAVVRRPNCANEFTQIHVVYTPA